MNYLEQLQRILKATGWSQEQLARELGISFPALNAWINKRSTPRAKAMTRIERLYIQIVGSDEIDKNELIEAKKIAKGLVYSVKHLLKDKMALDTLTLYLTYHTNTIEGSTMTISDVEDVIFDNKVLSNRTLIEQTEARNHQAALYWLLEQISEAGQQFTITEELVLGLHTRLMNGIISNPGKYRNHSVRIMGAHVNLVNWQKIPEMMLEFLEETNKPSVDIIKLLAVSHAKFEQIHPFSDGNGRTGRLLLLAQALSAGLTPPLVLKERKMAYYKYLEKAQSEEKLESLELFVAQAMIECAEILAEKSVK
jgi:Fic family protein